MDNQKIHFCLEAKDDEGKAVYVIYTSTLGDFKSDFPPHLTQQVVISCGVPSMGCGLFGSKLVLAGGWVQLRDAGFFDKHKGLITYDLTTQQLSHSHFPNMCEGKLRPLLFQLNNKLHALDTGTNKDEYLTSFEVYYPNQQRWHPLKLVLYLGDEYSSGKFADPRSRGISFFSWFAFGSTFCLSLPKNLSYIYHSRLRGRRVHAIDTEPLPFHGMGITYCQHDFKDVVVISLSQGGLVEGRRLLPTFCFSGEPPVKILDTKTYSHHVGDLNGCFAHFGDGNFCLTAFDNVNIYVHMFKISRLKNKIGENLKIQLIDYRMKRFKYTDFSGDGYTSFSFAGCFAPSPSGGSKETTEANIYNSWFECDKFFDEEDDVPGTECSNVSDRGDMDDELIFFLIITVGCILKLHLDESVNFTKESYANFFDEEDDVPGTESSHVSDRGDMDYEMDSGFVDSDG
ncbi:hypothetical protein POM88_040228 [Heracleum sosnowskyi]|uniref:Uncharacterized protein n=1 Tax=Heracleum sosnowskyi TaxID=360622 RepID=A0AAD8M9M0_9APIA|nr:hypothetical protein POM88_040228 [Heracleum sosnowskyi]